MASISPALAASVVARARGAGTRGRDASARDAGVGVGVGVASRGATRATTRAHRGRRCAARASASEPAEGATASGGAKSERRREENPYGVEAEDLYVRYPAPKNSSAPPKDALRGATLRVPRGTLYMLLGPNGCGKSTLLRTLAGLSEPWSGRLRVTSPQAFVFQNPDHQVIMPSVGADVAFGLSIKRADLTAEEVMNRVRAALAAVNLKGDEWLDKQVATLSGGQKQRVAIAGVLVENPRVMLLDELTTFLDEADQMDVVKTVRGVVDGEKVTAVWVTHRLEELRYCDRAAYMDGGRVVFEGTGGEVREYVRKLQEAYKPVVRGRGGA